MTSIPGISPLFAAIIIAGIGTIAHFERVTQLRSYFGWAPRVAQSGSSVYHVQLTPRGHRQIKATMMLIVWQVIRYPDNEWARISERLVQRKCSFNEKTRE